MPVWNAYRLHLVRAGVLAFASSLIWTAMIVYQVSFVGLQPLQLVLIGTVMEITILVFEIPTGIVADLYSRRLSFIIGVVTMGISYLMQGLIPIFEAILLAQVVWGLGFTFTSGAYEAWVVDELGQEQAGQAFIRASQVERIASIAGIILCGVVGSVDIRLPIVAGGIVVLLSGVMLIFIMPETGFTPTPRSERATYQKMWATFRDGARMIQGRPVLMNIIAVSLFYGLYSEAWDRLWQTHLINGVGLPQFLALPAIAWFTLITLGESILGFIGAGIMARRLDMGDGDRLRRALIRLNQVMIVSLLVYGLAQSFWVAIAAFYAFTLARGLSGPVFDTWTNQNIEPGVRATVLSMKSQMDALGEIAGGPPLGYVGQRSVPLAFGVSAALLAPAVWLLRRMGHLTRTRTTA